METNVIWRNARAAVIELDDGGYFTCADTWEIFVNDEPAVPRIRSRPMSMA